MEQLYSTKSLPRARRDGAQRRSPTALLVTNRGPYSPQITHKVPEPGASHHIDGSVRYSPVILGSDGRPPLPAKSPKTLRKGLKLSVQGDAILGTQVHEQTVQSDRCSQSPTIVYPLQSRVASPRMIRHGRSQSQTHMNPRTQHLASSSIGITRTLSGGQLVRLPNQMSPSALRRVLGKHPMSADSGYQQSPPLPPRWLRSEQSQHQEQAQIIQPYKLSSPVTHHNIIGVTASDGSASLRLTQSADSGTLRRMHHTHSAAVRNGSSDASSATETGSRTRTSPVGHQFPIGEFYGRQMSGIHRQYSEDLAPCPTGSTVSVDVAGMVGDCLSGKKELYPEKRSDPPPRMKSQAQMTLPAYEVMHQSSALLEFLNHKIDILEESLRLYDTKLGDMCNLAVTTAPDTGIDTEFCVCHNNVSDPNLGLGIWKYFCDHEKCRLCSELFDQLVNRPPRLSELNLSVQDLNRDLLRSGAISVQGDATGNLTVFIFSQYQMLDDLHATLVSNLSDIFLYILSTTKSGRISVIVDSKIKDVEHPTIQNIMDALCHAQKASRGGIAQSSFLVDQPSQTPRTLLRPTSKTTAIQIDITNSEDRLQNFSQSDLPVQLGGNHQFNSDQWIATHANLEQGLETYHRNLNHLLQATHDLSLIPRTIRHAGHVIQNHHKTEALLASAESQETSSLLLKDQELGKLLRNLQVYMRGTDVFSQIMENLQSLKQTNNRVMRLKFLAEERLMKLYGCQKIWFCIEEITKTLTLLRRAHELIGKHRILSSNLKSSQLQYSNFHKIQPSIKKLLQQGSELCTESLAVLNEATSSIPWLEQLATKLQTEIDFLRSLLDSTEALVTDTYQCYLTLDQAYDWAVESMKFVSSMNMDACLTTEGVNMLTTNLQTFMRDHAVIDNSIFDEVTNKARHLGNRKLMEQCRIARARCDETKQVLRVRQTTIAKAKEEIEACKAKKISMEQLAIDMDMVIASPSSQNNQRSEDIWFLQDNPASNTIKTIKEFEPNNNQPTESTLTREKIQHDCDSDATLTSRHHAASTPSLSDHESGIEMVAPPMENNSTSDISSSQEDTLNSSQCSQSKQHKVNAILSEQKRETSMHKRKSFAGFAQPLSIPSLQTVPKKKSSELNVNRLSDSTNTDVSEQDEGTSHTMDDESESQSSHSLDSDTSRCLVDQIRELGDIESMGRTKKGSDDSSSVTSLQEDQDAMTEDSGAITKSSSSTHSNQSAASATSQSHWSPVPVNSHLLVARQAAHRWQSMADLKLTEAEIRSRRTLAHIMNELIQTEEDYVKALKLVVEVYIPEMNREDVPQSLRGKRGVIFGNIEKIYDFHNHYFLKELSNCEQEPFKIYQCFIEHEKEFMMYALYNKNKPKSDQLMVEHGLSFFKELQHQLGDKMDLCSYLLKPLQRLGKYALILKQILKECPSTSNEFLELTKAAEMIDFSLQHGNDLLAMDALLECDVNLLEQGTLLLQHEFTLQKKHNSTKRQLFLFEDLLVFAKPRKIGAGRDQYLYKTSRKTADLGLTENVGNSGLKFEIWFRKRSRESWILVAPNPQIKNKWVSAFEKLLWNQAIKNRESRLQELSCMGIGHKPNLELKASEDNIHDRSVKVNNNKANQKRSLRECGESNSMASQSDLSILSTMSSSSSSLGNRSGESVNWAAIPKAQSITLLPPSSIPGSRTDPLLRRAVQSDGAMLASKLIKRSDSGISSISANSVHPKGTPSSMSYISLNGPADLTQDSGVLLAEVAENSLDKGDESEV